MPLVRDERSNEIQRGLAVSRSARANAFGPLCLLGVALGAQAAVLSSPGAGWAAWLAGATIASAAAWLAATTLRRTRTAARSSDAGGAGTRGPKATFEAAAPRLAEAFSVWHRHLQTAQSQTRDATDRRLAGFVSILHPLDRIIVTGADAAAAGGSDARARVLIDAEEDLKALLASLDEVLLSKDRVLGTIRELDGASKGLLGLAGMVDTVARQTNLLAIEAARAGPAGAGSAARATRCWRAATGRTASPSSTAARCT